MSDKRSILLVNIEANRLRLIMFSRQFNLFCSVFPLLAFVRASLIMHKLFVNWHLIDLLTCVFLEFHWACDHTLCALMSWRTFFSHTCPKGNGWNVILIRRTAQITPLSSCVRVCVCVILMIKWLIIKCSMSLRVSKFLSVLLFTHQKSFHSASLWAHWISINLIFWLASTHILF